MKAVYFTFVVLSSFFLLGCMTSPNPSLLGAKPLSLERIHSSPSLFGQTARGVQFSPDSRRVTYLKGSLKDKRVLELWELSLKDGQHRKLVDAKSVLGMKKEKLSDIEKARRERMRLSSTGIVQYQWHPDSRSILFPLSGSLYLYHLKSQKSERLISKGEAVTDPRFSPLGNFVSFLRNQNIFALDIKTRKVIQITKDGKGDVHNGVAEFIAQEEMRRFSGYWWSEDEKFIAYTQVDNRPVEVVERFEVYSDKTVVKKQRYPTTGTANAKVKLAVVRLSLGQPTKTQWIQLVDFGGDYYIPRVQWHPDQSLLLYQVQSRDQKHLWLKQYNPVSKQSKVLLRESTPKWVNILGKAYFIKGTDQWVWRSERGGFAHLYLYDKGQKGPRALTSGDWMVHRVLGINHSKKEVYFLGSQDSPLEAQIYAVNYQGAPKVQKVSSRPGRHWATFSEDAKFYVDSYSDIQTPLQSSVHKSSGERIGWLQENPLDSKHPLHSYKPGFSKWEFASFKNSSGHTLYYKFLKPSHFDRSKSYPIIVNVYGGPGAQLVKNSWAWNWELRSQFYAQQGYIVMVADNRGSAGRGIEFEQAIHKRLGHVEAQDQTAALRHMLAKGFVDPNRVAVMGHSYGGYMTLMLMFKYPELFRVGVAGAPVTDFSLYDTHYTERYLETPQRNPEGYQLSNVIPLAKNLKGELLVVHGMADDNVLFKNSTALFAELQKQKVPFQMMTYPGAKHGLSGETTQIHLDRTIFKFIKQNL